MTLHPALNRAQSAALIYEAQSVSNLLQATENALRAWRSATLNLDGLLSVGSIGTEKLLKFLMGCAHVSDEGSWPALTVLRDKWGHDINKLSGLLFARAKGGLDGTVHAGYASSTFERINLSETLRLLFEAFTQYGKSGRFHHLNTLCEGTPPRWPAPQECWDDVESYALHQLPAWTRELLLVPERAAECISALGDYVADQFVLWWCALHRLAAQDCFGSLAKQMSGEIWVPNKPKPI